MRISNTSCNNEGGYLVVPVLLRTALVNVTGVVFLVGLSFHRSWN
jgi:hypothetical protein